jgi:hypothetical protein
MTRIATLNLGGRAVRVRGDFALVLAIEEELGAIPELAARLKAGRWRAGEVVALAHILMEADGTLADYARLGDEMIARGLAAQAAESALALNMILEGEAA